MKELSVISDTLPGAYHSALVQLYRYAAITPCPDWNTTQKECAMTMTVLNPTAEPRISKLFIGGPRELEQYRMEMLDGILDFEISSQKWDYTYHNRMTDWHSMLHIDGLDQIQFVIDELKRNPYSRRAVIDVRNNAEDMHSADPACLQHIQYFIRDGKLDCMVLFRSNDACKAAFMNAFALICLQERIAEALGVPIGTYTHRANSFHCYKRDFQMLEGYVKRIGDAEALEDLCYSYSGDWDELMAEARPQILADVSALKERM